MNARAALACVSLLAIAGPHAVGQDCGHGLTGVVVDEHDDESLGGAAVYLLGRGVGAYADEAGRFALTGLCPGVDTLRATHIGCEPSYRVVEIGGDAAALTILLEHHAELLEGIEVHAHRNQTSASDIGATLDGEQLDRTAGADLAEVLRELPGVQRVATGGNVARPLVDGLGGSRLQLVQGGVALATQDWGDEHAPEIDPFATASIQLARSGATVGYGPATTGASLVLDDARMPTEPLAGRALLGGESNARAAVAGVSAAQRLTSRWGYRAQASARSAADARAPDYVLSNTGSRRLAGQARVYYADSTLDLDVGYRGFSQETGILAAAHVGNLTDLERAIRSAEPLVIRDPTRRIDAPRQRARHHWFTANAAYAIAPERKLRFGYSAQLNEREEFDRRRGGRSAIPSLDLTLATHDLFASYAVDPEGSPWAYVGGVQARTQANRNDSGTGTKPFVPYYDQESASAYAKVDRTSERWTLETSARADYVSQVAQFAATDEAGRRTVRTVERYNWTGTLAAGVAHYSPAGVVARARLAYASRTPNPAERFAEGVHHALAVIERGDTALTVEHGAKATLGIGVERDSARAVHISGFAHGFRDFIYQEAAADPVLTVRGAFPAYDYRQGDALLLGASLDAHHPVGPLQLAAEANYVYGRLAGGRPLPDVPPLRTRLDVSFAESASDVVKDYRVAAGVERVWRQGRAPESLPAPPPGGYTLVHAEASSHVALAGETLGVHLTLTNALNVAYRDYLDRLRFYADLPGINLQLRLLYEF